MVDDSLTAIVGNTERIVSFQWYYIGRTLKGNQNYEEQL